MPTSITASTPILLEEPLLVEVKVVTQPGRLLILPVHLPRTTIHS